MNRDKAKTRVKVVEEDGKLVASDPSSLDAALAALKEASSWSQAKEVLIPLLKARFS